MAYRNKVYVCFDADEDMNYYKTLKMWKENDNIKFTFNNAHELNNIRLMTEENIKRNLRERMKNSKLLMVLVGEKTKNLYKYVRWEIDLAFSMNIPIIAVNLNKKNGIDRNLCPPILKDETVVHIPYTKNFISFAMTDWVANYQKCKNEGKINLYYEL